MRRRLPEPEFNARRLWGQWSQNQIPYLVLKRESRGFLRDLLHLVRFRKHYFAEDGS